MKSISMKNFILVLVAVFAIPSLASAATLSVSPSSHTVKAGDTFSISVRLDTQGDSVDGVDLRYLNYNPSLLQVLDADASKAGVQITPGTLMPMTLLNNVDQAAGKISFSQVSAGGTKYKGSGTLATISFKALASGSTQLTFNHTPSNTTDSNVAMAGKDTLSAVINGSITISGGVGVVSPRIPGNVVPPVTGRSNVSGTDNFVPLPPVDTQDQVMESGGSGSISDIVDYIFSRIKNGFLKIFGASN